MTSTLQNRVYKIPVMSTLTQSLNEVIHNAGDKTTKATRDPFNVVYALSQGRQPLHRTRKTVTNETLSLLATQKHQNCITRTHPNVNFIVT